MIHVSLSFFCYFLGRIKSNSSQRKVAKKLENEKKERYETRQVGTVSLFSKIDGFDFSPRSLVFFPFFSMHNWEKNSRIHAGLHFPIIFHTFHLFCVIFFTHLVGNCQGGNLVVKATFYSFSSPSHNHFSDFYN